MRNQLRPEVERDIERGFDNEREAFKLLDLIDAEFQSDPLSVQCFDLRVVERVRQCVKLRKELAAKHPLYFRDN